MMNPHTPGLVIGAGFLAFHNGLMRGRAMHNARVAAENERRRRVAEERRFRRLENEVRAARAATHSAQADAILANILRRL